MRDHRGVASAVVVCDDTITAPATITIAHYDQCYHPTVNHGVNPDDLAGVQASQVPCTQAIDNREYLAKAPRFAWRERSGVR